MTPMSMKMPEDLQRLKLCRLTALLGYVVSSFLLSLAHALLDLLLLFFVVPSTLLDVTALRPFFEGFPRHTSSLAQ